MVKIKLPNPNDFDDPYVFFRQLELAVHHAQKSLEQLQEERGYDPEELFATFKFPEIDLYDREQDEDGYVKVHVDEQQEKFTEIEINLQSL